ncbi:MAG TPA: hypothetical protein DDZ41_06990 [Flavobacterium sp.]|nr:hypothetical protein [Flavobacterium sp.]
MQNFFIFLFVSTFLLSCEEDTTAAENKRILAKNKATFSVINDSWNLTVPPASALVTNALINWNAWQQFTIEVNQKPKNNLTAFQLKTKNLSSKIDSLQFNIPFEFDKPQVKSRISALSTKIKMLDTYIHVTDVPQQKIKTVIAEINLEIVALINQCEEIIIIKQIPREAGEDYMIKALDTTRNASREMMIEKIKSQDSLHNMSSNLKTENLKR